MQHHRNYINVYKMFTKARLSFAHKLVFEKDFKPNIERAFCVVSRMMFEDRINIDGTINMEQAGYLKKWQLWSYIYYLYYYNNSSVEEFVTMKNPKNGKANAVLFYESVRKVIQNQYIGQDEITPFDVNSLIYFINVVSQKYGEDMKNPVVDYLRKILRSKSAVDQISKFTLVTGTKEGQVQLVNKEENANIKVKFGYL